MKMFKFKALNTRRLSITGFSGVCRVLCKWNNQPMKGYTKIAFTCAEDRATVETDPSAA